LSRAVKPFSQRFEPLVVLARLRRQRDLALFNACPHVPALPFAESKGTHPRRLFVHPLHKLRKICVPCSDWARRDSKIGCHSRPCTSAVGPAHTHPLSVAHECAEAQTHLLDRVALRIDSPQELIHSFLFILENSPQLELEILHHSIAASSDGLRVGAACGASCCHGRSVGADAGDGADATDGMN
jgi:hypothetical protein